MLKNHLHTAVILATAAFAPLSLEAGKLDQDRFAVFQEDNKATTAATPAPAAKVEPGKLGQRFARLNIPVRNTTDTPEELAAKLTKQRNKRQPQHLRHQNKQLQRQKSQITAMTKQNL